MKDSEVLTRKDLIEICDQFLKGKIDKIDVENFASEILYNNVDFEDETVAEIIVQWNNEIINFEINQLNKQLWKEKLLTDKNELLSYNSWNFHINNQKEICKKYNSEWKPINKTSFIAISDDKSFKPINGLRHLTKKREIQWFIWFGEWSNKDDFYKPMCAEHLLKICPKIVDYLGLEPGFRFLIDKNGYEDVWFDNDILKIEY